MKYENTFFRPSMDLSTKKVISLGLVFAYLLSIAVLVPAIFAAPQGLITAVINPVTGGNSLWGRSCGIIQTNGIQLTAINLTYVPPFNTTLPLKVVNQSIYNGTLYYYNTSGFKELAKLYGISMTPIGKIVNVTSKFTATTTTNVTPVNYPPYDKGNCYRFNTTPPSPFYYRYTTSANLNSYFPNTQYITANARLSNFCFNVSRLTYNTTITLSIYAVPAIQGLMNSKDFMFNFTVKLCANRTITPYTTYTLTAAFYFNNKFICQLINTKTSVPGSASANSPTTISFTSYKANYILLVNLGLWSNVSTVYVAGVKGPNYPDNTVTITNNASFHPVIIPPAIYIEYKTFYSDQINPLHPETSGPQSIPYMIANVTVYAPDDILNVTYAWKYQDYYNWLWDPYHPINEAWYNNFGHGGNGLTAKLVVGNKEVVSINFPYLALCKVSSDKGYYNFVYKFSIQFLLSNVNNLTYIPTTVKSNSTGVGGNMLYVYIKPSDLKDAKIVLIYNDSDYAVQYYFGPVNRNIAVTTNDIKVYTPLLYMPKCVPLSAPFINGQIIDYDLGYHFVMAAYVNNYQSYYVYIQEVPGNSLLLLESCPDRVNASVSLYYPNTPPDYPASHQVKVGKITGVFVQFANGTKVRIYLSPENITTLFTSVTMSQMAPMPPFWNYSFLISIPGLEKILGITPTQALSVLNNSYVIVCYYDMASRSVVQNMTKLVAGAAALSVTPASPYIPYAPATPFDDIIRPGAQIYYLVNVNSTYPITITLNDKTLGELSPNAILTVNVSCIYVVLYNGSVVRYSNTVFPIALVETAPGSGQFKATIQLQITDSKGKPVTAYPLNYSYLALYNPATGKKVIVGKLPNIMPLEEGKYFKVGLVVNGQHVTTTFTLTEVYNVIYNVTPLIYNYIDGEFAVIVAANIPNYYYSGYLVLTIYNSTSKPEKPFYTYEIYFNLSPSSPQYVAAFNLLSLAPILNGHKYYVEIVAITVPLTYKPLNTIGTSGKVYAGVYYFSTQAGS